MQNFQIQVAVDASNDLQDWDTRADNVSLTRIKNATNSVTKLSVDIGGAPARYFRVRLMDGEVNWDSEHAPSVDLQGHDADSTGDDYTALQWQSVVDSTTADDKTFDYRLAAALPKRSTDASRRPKHVPKAMGTDAHLIAISHLVCAKIKHLPKNPWLHSAQHMSP